MQTLLYGKIKNADLMVFARQLGAANEIPNLLFNARG